MPEFKRGLGEEPIKKLKQEDLFTGKLLPDIQKGNVFFAIRPGYASFYFKGSSLFKYEKGEFSTHRKFAFVPQAGRDYIKENELETMKVETKFWNGYEKIKELANQYSKIEAEGVSTLYQFAPNIANKGERYFFVDIEVVFGKDNRSTDQIDVLLYDNHEKRLLFCEAKHFSNQEIWAHEGSKPKVIGQLERYNSQIAANKPDILNAYEAAFAEYNQLMGTELRPPINICEKCGLLVFGFDSLQREKINKLLIEDGSIDGHQYKFIGNPGSIKIEDLFQKLWWQ